MTDEKEMREAFEKWACDNCIFTEGDIAYNTPDVQRGWFIWQAATAQSAETIRQLQARVAELKSQLDYYESALCPSTSMLRVIPIGLSGQTSVPVIGTEKIVEIVKERDALREWQRKVMEAEPVAYLYEECPDNPELGTVCISTDRVIHFRNEKQLIPKPEGKEL